MKLQMIKMVMAGACALAIAFAAQTASAQPVNITFEAGEAETIDVTATINNSIDAAVTQPNMGTWGVIRSAVAGQQATMTLTDAGVQTANTNGTARTIAGGGTIEAGQVVITGAFPETRINVSFDNLQNLVCTGCPVGNPELHLYRVFANTIAPVVGQAALVEAVRDTVVPTNTTGNPETTVGTGNLTFNFGVAARTTIGATPYASGVYEGSFDALVQY